MRAARFPEGRTMHVLVVTKTGAVPEGLVAALREAGHAVTTSAASPEVAVHIRELPLGAIVVESVHGEAAEEFRRRVRRARPECKVILVSGLEAASSTKPMKAMRADEIALRESEFASLLERKEPTPSAETGDAKIRSLIRALDVAVTVIESDDPYFAGTSHRIAEVAAAIARKMGLGTEAEEEIEVAALLHDIGKTALEPALMRSEGILEEAAAARMREHVTWGVRLLDHIEFPWRIREIVRHHHERYDGSGYPDGLQGRAIPVGARILAAVDAFTAMVSHRRHRAARTMEQATDELVQASGTQLDPEVVEVLIQVVADRARQVDGGPRPRVVIVDPDEVFQRLVRLRLVTEGIEVEGRSGIEPAVSLIGEGGVALLIVALGSGGAAAIEAAREAAAFAGHPEVPIAVAANEDDRALRLSCLRLGVEDYFAKSDDLEDFVARIKNILVRERRRSGSEPAEVPEGLSGSLESMDLAEIAHFLALGQKTARVTLAEDGTQGQVWLDGGHVVHAECGESEGEEAFFELLGWRAGRFQIRHGVAAPHRRIQADTLALVLEGLRRRDEAAAGIAADAGEPMPQGEPDS